MSQEILAPQGKLRIFALGGAGINIASALEVERTRNDPAFAKIETVYVDTSLASIPADVDPSHFYKLENADGNTDGSGGVRGHNAGDIADRNLEILQKFPPLDANLVISSMSGGSGGVFANTIVSELLRQDKPTIVLAIGADDTRNFINNTINSLLSYEKMAEIHGRPVVLFYAQNGENGATVEQVNERVTSMVSGLALAFSRRNKNLDSRDTYNWLNFHNVTSFKPQVAVLSMHFGPPKLQDEQLISLLTLSSSMNNTRVEQLVEYQRVGILQHLKQESDEVSTAVVSEDKPVHFAITDGFLNNVVRKLRKRMNEFDETAAARKKLNVLSTGNEKVTSNGLVL